MSDAPAPRTLLDLHRTGELYDVESRRPESATLCVMNPKQADLLRTLQHTIIAGQRAMEERNALLLALFDQGATQSSLVSVLNEVNREVRAPEITADAVHRAVKRLRAKGVS